LPATGTINVPPAATGEPPWSRVSAKRVGVIGTYPRRVDGTRSSSSAASTFVRSGCSMTSEPANELSANEPVMLTLLLVFHVAVPAVRVP